VDEIPNEIVVPKIGTIPSVIHRPVDGIVKSITISKNSAGQYHAAVLVEDEIEQPEECPEGKTLGIDLGLTDFAVTTDDEYIANPKHFKRSRRNLKHKQQDLARCKRGSNRRRKAVLRLARIHLRISNQRKDFLHKTSRHLVDENQVIVVENLNIRGMMKNHHLANAIGTAGWGQFVSFCRYKAQRVGKMVLKCGRFVPSSKRCSCCGTVNRDLKLSQRVWTCDACGTVHHRDRNASNNILRGGLLETYPIGYLLDQGILEKA
jgi:putative transposase